MMMVWTEERFADLVSFLEGKGSVFHMSPPRQRIAANAEQDILDYIEESEELTFSQTLLRLIDGRGLTDVEVYKAAKVDRRVFSKLRSNDDYQPSRSTAIRLCLALSLPPLEAMMLLEKAGLCLSPSSKEDLVVYYCLEHGIFDVNDVNEALSRLGLKTLN